MQSSKKNDVSVTYIFPWSSSFVPIAIEIVSNSLDF